MQRVEGLSAALGHGYFGESQLERYRGKGSICPRELEKLLYGKGWESRREMFRVIQANPKIFTHSFLEEESRAEKRLSSVRKLRKVFEAAKGREEQEAIQLSLLSVGLYSYDLSISVKFGVHYYLYYKTLFFLGTERHRAFKARALDYEDIGCFALTELMHGSNVRGILTQARYDPAARQFVLDSGSEYGMKFWIGAAANLANVAVVWAQLCLGAKCHGVHAFVVPIRDKDTHKPLPGVTIGDCGPKMGLDSIDNGFLVFRNVRIPKDNLLNRLSDVTEAGEFTSSVASDDKRFGLQLGALSGGRVIISLNGTVMAESALVICSRYIMTRKQFSIQGQQEACLFEYPLVRARLVPMVAQAVVYNLAAIDLLEAWDAAGLEVLDLKNNLIEFIHAVSSVMKAKASWFADRAIGECRQLMGGHGFSALSKMATLLNDNHVNMTWEGDNNILLMQTQKFLLDGVRKVAKQKPIHATLEFIRERRPAPESGQLDDLEALARLFENRVVTRLDFAVAKMMELKGAGLTDAEVFNAAQPHILNSAALCFGDLHYLRVCAKKAALQSGPLRKALEDCLKLWAFKELKEEGYGCEAVKATVIDLLNKYTEEVSPEAARLVDAFAPPAEVIGSPFAFEENGFERYISQLYSAKGTFERVPWWQEIHSQR